ncbi:hypothetical protein CDAR_366761 [Caerostris darwini]|uniref:Uncharacterized protein n=1 Tax=Caerostris darwini TaxID=1538125 RepID=A0AAV4Q5K3_9ARAC|nr:hypothetical protein CDAR_366761 [Caerostris darwini]
MVHIFTILGFSDHKRDLAGLPSDGAHLFCYQVDLKGKGNTKRQYVAKNCNPLSTLSTDPTEKSPGLRLDADVDPIAQHFPFSGEYVPHLP